MVRRIAFALLWLGFVGYAFGLAPPDQPDTWDLIVRLSTGDWAGINPVVVALFNLMGLWPLAYASLALVDGQGQSIPAWPFVVASFGIGAFAILPYLVLRSPQPTPVSVPSWRLQLLTSRWLGGLVLLGAGGLLTYGGGVGDWADFVQQWQTSRFIHVMGLDFCALWLLVPTLLGDDMARRGESQPWRVALITALPLVGIATYLTLRPPLPQAQGD